MGTNYYVGRPGRCASCGGDQPLHIGKASIGWAFCFRAHGDLGLASLKEWRAYLQDKEIHDEYGTRVSLDDLLRLVDAKKFERKDHGHGEYSDADGYRFSPLEFH